HLFDSGRSDCELHDLHSFPTRRSSDLGYGYNDSRYEKVDADMQDISGNHPLATPMNSANYWASYKFPQGRLEGFGLGLGGNYSGDRKSTRLNSSHVSISYAVFCLNKKT